MSDIVLSLLALGVVVMAVGAWVAQRKGDRKRALLMLAVAAVMAMNVAIWTVPTAQDRSLAEAAGNRLTTPQRIRGAVPARP